MEQDNNNPVVKTMITVISHRDVGPHNPFAGVTEQEIIDTVCSFNGVWACNYTMVNEYRYETHRTVDVELYKREYDILKSEQAVLGWSEFEITIGEIIGTQHLPTTEKAQSK